LVRPTQKDYEEPRRPLLCPKSVDKKERKARASIFSAPAKKEGKQDPLHKGALYCTRLKKGGGATSEKGRERRATGMSNLVFKETRSFYLVEKGRHLLHLLEGEGKRETGF